MAPSNSPLIHDVESTIQSDRGFEFQRISTTSTLSRKLIDTRQDYVHSPEFGTSLRIGRNVGN